MNTFNFILALAIAHGTAARPEASSGSTATSANSISIKTKNGELSSTIQSDEFTCPTGGKVTFTIDSSFNDARPFIFPEIDSAIAKAEIHVVDTASALKISGTGWTHQGDYETAKATAATKEATKIKKFIYSGAKFDKKKFSAEVLLPKTDDTTKKYTTFTVSVKSECPLVPKQQEEKDQSDKVTKAAVPEIPAVDVTKVFTFESSAARYIPGLAIAAVSALGYLML